MSRITNRLSTGLAAFAVLLLAVPAASATPLDGVELDTGGQMASFLGGIANLFTGPLGIAIGVIAFAAVGVYIMYARQTGQAVGSIAKVFVGMLILFGGTTMIAQFADTVTGAAF